MGLFAAGIAGYKTAISKKLSRGDFLSSSVELSLWNRLEGLVGLTAACMPCLKSPAERLLRRLCVRPKNLRFTKPSFVISLEERHVKATKRSGDDTWGSDFVRIDEENTSKNDTTGSGTKGSDVTAEEIYPAP